MELYRNEAWFSDRNPIITILTPVYNRSHLLPRALSSVKKQTFKYFEHIIINDGSTENLDNIVQEYMGSVDYPVLYIKKEKNGGVHTARNAGIKKARGKMTTFLDSDDAFVPYALEFLWKSWNNIPEQIRNDYMQIAGRCMLSNGNMYGNPFPDNINNLPYNQVREIVAKINPECIQLLVTQILKENPWPEPKGITFVSESYVWRKLQQKYKTFYVNDMLRIYYTDADGSYIRPLPKRTIQDIRNYSWNLSCELNDYKLTHMRTKKRLLGIFRFSIYSTILKIVKDESDMYGLCGVNKWIQYLFYFPSWILAKIYIRKKLREM